MADTEYEISKTEDEITYTHLAFDDEYKTEIRKRKPVAFPDDNTLAALKEYLNKLRKSNEAKNYLKINEKYKENENDGKIATEHYKTARALIEKAGKELFNHPTLSGYATFNRWHTSNTLRIFDHTYYEPEIDICRLIASQQITDSNLRPMLESVAKDTNSTLLKLGEEIPDGYPLRDDNSSSFQDIRPNNRQQDEFTQVENIQQEDVVQIQEEISQPQPTAEAPKPQQETPQPTIDKITQNDTPQADAQPHEEVEGKEMAEETNINEKKSLKELNQEIAVEILSNPKNLNKMHMFELLKTQKIVNDALQQQAEGKQSETIDALTSPKAQKNLNYAVLGILEAVAAGVPLVDGSVDDKVKGSNATVWKTYKAQKSQILALIDNAPEDFKTNFKSTIEMVNRRLRPTNEQKPTVKLYKGDLKKGFINSVIYNNFYASNSWGKKNIIRPWRKFKRDIKKAFGKSYASKLDSLRLRNNIIKFKLWRQEKLNDAKKWVKSRPSWLNKKRKEYGGKIAKWFKEKTWVGKKLVQANKWRKETGLKIKNKAIEIGNKAWNVTKTVGHAIYVGAKYTALGATAPIWGPPYLAYLAYKGAKAAATWTKGQYSTAKKNIKEGMQATIDRSAEDRDKYARRNPHPYKGKKPVYTMSEEDQKKIDMALNAYTNQARPTQEVEMQNGNIVTRKDTTKWVADDVERQAASEMLGKLLQSKDNGGLELPKEQAKEIIDFFNKQGLMKSTYDDIAKDDSLSKPVNEQERDQQSDSTGDKTEKNKGEEHTGDEEKDTPKEIPLEKQMEQMHLEGNQQTIVFERLQLLKQMKKNGTDKQVLEQVTQNYMQTFEKFGVSQTNLAKIKEMNPDLFPEKEQEADDKKKENEGTGVFETVIEKNDKGFGVKITHGKGDIPLENDQPSGTPQSDTLVEEQGEKAKIVEMNIQIENTETRNPLSNLDTKTWNALLKASAKMQDNYDKCMRAGHPQEAKKHLDGFEERLTSPEKKKGNFNLSKEQAEAFKASQAEKFSPWKKQQVSEGQSQSRTISFTKGDYANG